MLSSCERSKRADNKLDKSTWFSEKQHICYHVGGPQFFCSFPADRSHVVLNLVRSRIVDSLGDIDLTLVSW